MGFEATALLSRVPSLCHISYPGLLKNLFPSPHTVSPDTLFRRSLFLFLALLAHVFIPLCPLRSSSLLFDPGINRVDELDVGEGEVAHLPVQLALPLAADAHLGHLGGNEDKKMKMKLREIKRRKLCCGKRALVAAQYRKSENGRFVVSVFGIFLKKEIFVYFSSHLTFTMSPTSSLSAVLSYALGTRACFTRA